MQPLGSRLNKWNIITLVSIFFVALYIRYEYMLLTGGLGSYLDWANVHYFGGISSGYLQLAQELIQYHHYQYTAYPPGYTVFIALWKLIGIENLTYIRLIQAAISSASVFMIYYIARYFNINKAICLFGALAYAVIPIWAASSVYLMAEFISSTIILLSLCLMISLVQPQVTSRYPKIALLGLTISIGAMFRPDLILLILVVGLFLILSNWKKGFGSVIKQLLVLFISFAVLVGAWAVHNKQTYGHIIITSTSGGNTLWEGLGEIENPYGYKESDAVAGEVLTKLGMEWHTYESNKYFMQQYLLAWKNHPAYVLKTIMNRWHNIVFQISNYSVSNDPKFFQYLYAAYSRLGLILLLIGMVISRKSWREMYLLALPLIYALFSIGLTHYEFRYVIYAYFSYIFASLIIFNAIYDWLLNTRISILVMLAKILPIIAAIVFLLPIYNVHHKAYIATQNYIINNQLKKVDYSQRKPNLTLQNLNNWSQNTPGNQLLRSDDGLTLITNSLSYSFQYLYPLPTGNTKGYIVTYKVKLISGATTISIFNQELQNNISSVLLNQPNKVYEGVLYAPIINKKSKVSLALSNSAYQASSKMLIEKLDIYRIDKN